jgi:nucleotide-binding universal stress UspA family protein
MYTKIMVPLDGSELAESVLPHVKAFIEKFNIKEVVLARVVDPVLAPRGGEEGEEVLNIEEMERWEASRISGASKYLDGVAKRLKYEGTTVRSEVFVGRVTETLVDYAERNAVDMIIIGTHGRSGLTRWVLGSVADKLLHSASVPVLMIRASGAKGGI